MDDTPMPDRVEESRRKRLIVCRGCCNDIPCTSCAPGQQYDDLATIARDAERLQEEREELVDALRWCSGSADFAPEGQAREGWQRVVQPLLDISAAREAVGGEDA